MQGKVVLITGGAKRVGAATCRRLHASGANLMLHYRESAGEARLLQAELNNQRKDSVALIQADLLDLGKLQSIVDQTLQTFSRLDALVNNASSFFQTPVGEITVAQWEDLIGTNLRATVATTAPNFVRGSVVLVASGFKSLAGPLGYVGSAIACGVFTLGVAWLGFFGLRETFGVDLDYLESDDPT